MYQKKNRTKDLARRTFVYTLMTLSLIILLTFLTFRMLGYTFDPNTKNCNKPDLSNMNHILVGRWFMLTIWSCAVLQRKAPFFLASILFR